MNEHIRLPKKGFTKYQIGPNALVTVTGLEAQYVKAIENGVVLREVEGSKRKFTRAYTWEEIYALVTTKKMTIDNDYFTERNAIMRARDKQSHELPPETILRVVMVSTFIGQEEEIDGPGKLYGRSVDGINAFYAAFKEENQELIDEAAKSIAKNGKGKLFVSPRQFQRLLERFEKAEMDEVSLVSRQEGRSASGSSFSAESLQYQLKYLETWRTENQGSLRECWQSMIDDNEKHRLGHKLPSYTTYWRLVSEGNDFINDVGRSSNLARLERKYNFKKKGLEVTRPLEIVEMDEHLFHLMTLVTKNGLAELLHPDVLVRIDKIGRLWLSVALDAYSRSVVGAKFLKGAPDASSAVATLAMIGQHKDRLAASVGALTGWPQGGTPEAIHTDAGAGYVSSRFELACFMFCGRHRIPPSKHPHLRARVERFFRTLNQRYIHLFQGQTFSSPLLRDEYDSEKHAHLTDEEFADLLLRLILDCYHNSHHRSLGMTPLQAWERGSQLGSGAVAAHPTPDRYREIFGATITRSIGSNGISIAGNIYSSPGLLEIRKKWFRRKLMIRMDDQSIDSISVKHIRLNKWVKVPAVFDGLKGVTMDEWLETVRFMKVKYGVNTTHSQERVRESIAAVKTAIAKSQTRPGVAMHEPLTEKLEKIDREIDATFKYSQPQPYDYDSHDDFVDHEDDADEYDVYNKDEDEKDEAAAKKTKPGRNERVIQLTDSRGNPFKPVGAEFDRSSFLSAEERKRSRPGEIQVETDTDETFANEDVPSESAQKDAGTPAPSTVSRSTTTEEPTEQKRRRPMRREDRSEEDSK